MEHGGSARVRAGSGTPLIESPNTTGVGDDPRAMTDPTTARQMVPAEDRYADELAFLAAWDLGAKPIGGG